MAVQTFRQFISEGAAEQIARADEAGYVYRVFRGAARFYLGGAAPMIKAMNPPLDSDRYVAIMRSHDNYFDWHYDRREKANRLYFNLGGYFRQSTKAASGVYAGPWRDIGVALVDKITDTEEKNVGGDYQYGPVPTVRLVVPQRCFDGKSPKEQASKIIRWLETYPARTVFYHEMAHHFDYTQSSHELALKKREYGKLSDEVEFNKYLHVGIEMQARLIQLVSYMLEVIGRLYDVKQRGFSYRFSTFPLFRQFFSKEIDDKLFMSRLDDEGKKYMLSKLYRLWDYLGTLTPQALEKLANDLGSNMYLRRKDRLGDVLQINDPKIYPVDKYDRAKDGFVWIWLKTGNTVKSLWTKGSMQRSPDGIWRCWDGSEFTNDQIAGWQRFRGVIGT